MAGKNVRLRYSGFVLFLSRLIGVGTGLLFALLITRSVSVEEFGVYGNMGDTMSYFTFASLIIPFWATRFTVREHEGSSKTGLVANLLISIIFTSLYLLLLPSILPALQLSKAYMLVYAVLAIQILETYVLSAFNAIFRAKKPHTVGYGLLIFEIGKVILGFALILQLKLGLLGAVISVILAHLIRFVFYTKLSIRVLNEKVRWNYVKEWLKASPANLYSIIGQRLTAFALILLFIYGGELARAYYGAALTIANIVGYSSFLSFALYPRLLSEAKADDVTQSLKMILMFALPMSVGAIVLSDSYLIVLKPDYQAAKFVLILLSLNAVLLSLSQMFLAVVRGTERLDVKARIPLKELIKSRLFLAFSLPYLQAVFVIPSAYFVLNFVIKDEIEAASLLALINLITNIVMIFLKYYIAKRCLDFKIPWSKIIKYLGASAVMASILISFPTPTRFSSTLFITAIGGGVYFLFLSLIDRETRDTVRLALNEIMKKTTIFK